MNKKLILTIFTIFICLSFIYTIGYSASDAKKGAKKQVVAKKTKVKKAEEGTVLAEFYWGGKQRITLQDMEKEIKDLPEWIG